MPEMEHCQWCGQPYLTVYRVPDDVWGVVSPGGRINLMCPRCVDEITRERGAALYWEAAIGRYPTTGLWLRWATAVVVGGLVNILIVILLWSAAWLLWGVR